MVYGLTMNFDFQTVDTCIYHKDCADGFCAAWIFNNYSIDRSVKFIPMTHGMNPEDIKEDIVDKNVLIVDFSFKRPTLLNLKSLAKSILVVDHHKTAKDDLEGLDFVVFDMEKCGASLLWHVLYNSKPPFLVEYVEDRDLWKWKLDNSKYVNAAIQIAPYDFTYWNALFSSSLSQLIDVGRPVCDAFNHLAKTTAKDATLVKLAVPSEIKINPPPFASLQDPTSLHSFIRSFNSTRIYIL
jgi:oligoribonuclease NrnB/cAMP/cGMP phosphodiesterase (DHH superfamily)